MIWFTMRSLVIISSPKCYYYVIDHIPYAVYYISVTNYNWRLGPTGFLSLMKGMKFSLMKIPSLSPLGKSSLPSIPLSQFSFCCVCASFWLHI